MSASPWLGAAGRVTSRTAGVVSDPPSASPSQPSSSSPPVDPDRHPFDVDPGVARPERLHDQLIGGRSGFAADRELADRLRGLGPDEAGADRVREAVRELDAFMARAVRYLAAEAGIRQFLHAGSGSGIAPGKWAHQVAQEVAPSCRTVTSG
jgi:hypothetical protein